jgi:LysR family transcriptional regulator, hca operon transcriptional activator
MQKVLRVGCLPGLEPDVLPPISELAHKHAPNVEVQIVGASSLRLVELLRAGELDMALMRYDAKDLQFKLISTQPIIVLLPADHGLSKKRTLELRDLLGQP